MKSSSSTLRSFSVPCLNCQVLGAAGTITENLEGKTLRTNGPSSCPGLAPVFPDWGQLAISSEAPGLLSQVVRSPGLLCSPCDRPMRDEARKRPYSKKADQDNGRLVPQNNHLVKAWLPGSFLDQRLGCGGVGAECEETK